jgi:hypothetical protein
MTGDVRTLLHDTAETPSREPDIGAALRTARDRRRRRRGFSTLAAVLVTALVTGALVLGGGSGDEARVAIGPRQVGSAIPEGWQPITTDSGVSLSVPPGWKSESTSATPIGTPMVNVSESANDTEDVLLACTMHRDPASPPTSPASLLTLWEVPADSTQVTDVANGTLDVVDRPVSFAGALVPGPNECHGARYDQLAFQDAGRVFLVRVVSVYPTAADEEVRLALAARVLDTLRVQPLEAATTTTAPATTTTPTATVVPGVTAPTSAAPFVPNTDDERAIVALVARWLTFQSDDGIRETLIDADSILDLIHEGTRQYQMNMPDGYSGELQSLQFDDATHARFTFTLLLHGQPLYMNQQGEAVKIDGRWMMTRQSECSLLALGQLICPPPK